MLVTVIGVALLWSVRRDPEVPLNKKKPAVKRRNDYITSAACRECHSAEFDTWHDTYHRTMTQEASIETVVAPIDDITVESRGRSYRFYRKGDEFRVNMVDPEWEIERLANGLSIDGIDDPPMVDLPIVMTTGSHHYQAYWIRGARGTALIQVPFVYHIKTQQWIPKEDSFLQIADKRQFSYWNNNCIICHTVGGRPGRNLLRNEHNSKVVELGIACEACHGPGGKHAEVHRSNKSATSGSGSKITNQWIVNPLRLDSRRSAAVCGQCHCDYYPRDLFEWEMNGYANSFRPGELLDEARVVVRYPEVQKHAKEMDEDLDLVENAFWPDGTHRIGGREYNGLIESACYQKGKMACLSCHSMHNYREPNDLLSAKLNDNESCLQCHADFADRISEHTHHQPSSAGSQCYNCHMPHTTYALFKAIRSHRIDSPNSKSFVKSGRPNACNLCHLDQTLKWTVDHLHNWYGQPKVPLEKDDQAIAASILWMLKGNAVQRAITVWSAGWAPAKEASKDDWTVPYVAELLTDPYSAIRFISARTLKNSDAKLDPNYNFIGSQQDWERQQAAVIQAWKDAHLNKHPDRHQRLLLDSKGLPMRSEVDRLLRLRDNRRIAIGE